jgi:hypothetical protein
LKGGRRRWFGLGFLKEGGGERTNVVEKEVKVESRVGGRRVEKKV